MQSPASPGFGRAALVSLVLFLVACPPASGQMIAGGGADAPGPSNFTLLDPVPDDRLRSFCTDRPTKSNLPCTVDAGHVQIESDLFNWSYASFDGTRTNTYLFTNPTFKLGLTNTIDVEANIAPAERVTVKDPLARQDLTGLGDLYLRMKFNIVNEEGGNVQATLLPYVSFALPGDFTLLFDPEIDVLRNELNFGRHASVQNLVNLSHALADGVTGYAELWGEIDDDPSRTVHEASLDLAVAWSVPNAKDLQLDIGMNIGLTAATPRLQAYLGLSHRF
jgi:hypothetical protein